MNLKDQQNEMLEYVNEKLRLAEHIVKPQSEKIFTNITSNFILVDEFGVVFLVDKNYPSKQQNGKLTSRLFLIKEYFKKQKKNNIAFIFLKDGETFFRSAAKDISWKKYNLSLKQYNKGGERYRLIENLDPIQRMIMLTNEEIYNLEYNTVRGGNIIQYFQPQTSRLKNTIVTFQYYPIKYDYSHPTKIEEEREFIPTDRNSLKIHKWEKNFKHTGALYLSDEIISYTKKIK